jgi:hypothetical protein
MVLFDFIRGYSMQIVNRYCQRLEWLISRYSAGDSVVVCCGSVTTVKIFTLVDDMIGLADAVRVSLLWVAHYWMV